MEGQFERTSLILTDEGVGRLKRSRVAVFGVGGVGSYTVEALARSGVGALDIIDNDTVSLSNINRQLIALHSTLGMQKTEAAARRVHDICPDITVTRHDMFFLPETELDLSVYDYVVDAVDTVSAKIELVLRCEKAGVPIISSMGTGNKLDPARFKVADIYKTSGCPLARVMRYELKKRGVKKLKVVYSDELPVGRQGESDIPGKRSVPGSVAFMPSVAGLIIAGEVIKELSGYNK